jgi:RNA polymerase sigma-70 factor (ECF subfamily)
MTNEPRHTAAATLGDVLYSNSSRPLIPETDWLSLVQSIGAGDQLALHDLYARTHRAVFTLIMRITSNRKMAEELMLAVFHDVWRRASDYNPASGTVLAWVMNQARSCAIDRLRLEHRKKRIDANPDARLLAIDTAEHGDLLEVKEQSRAMRSVLSVLTSHELAAIEAAFFSELTHAEVAARLDQPAEAVKQRIRSGLHKLNQALAGGKGAMSAPSQANDCEQAELTSAFALRALSPGEVFAMGAHLSSCWRCRRELDVLRPALEALAFWPTDILRPPPSLQRLLAHRIAVECGGDLQLPPISPWWEPDWKSVAPAISCKLLSNDANKHVVGMLVRLVPRGEYPPHTHSGVEELYLLDGELWIDDRKLHPGDYNRAEPGTSDRRVWSETGCTCVLITSTRDVLSAD